MTDKLKAAKDGAKRKREHDDRKRAQGLKEFRSWATDEEREMLREALANFRNTPISGKNKQWQQNT